jgi:anti-sigma factor RsiW
MTRAPVTCTDVEPELVAYHFGLLEDDARTVVEEHLVSCGACLRAFIELKRAVETGAADGPLPSNAARARLRRAVATELGVATEAGAHDKSAMAAAKRRWWERPVAFAVAASLVLVAGRTTHALTSGPASPPYAMSEGRYNHAP